MTDTSVNLTPHFKLAEFMPHGATDVPADVRVNLTKVALLLEGVRWHAGLPLIVHSGWRLADHNAAVGGAHESDHLTGSAADFNVADGSGQDWITNTYDAFDYARIQLFGRFGQLILEDHRAYLNNPAKLWVHISLPDVRHPASAATGGVLVSRSPGHYEGIA